MKRRRKRNFFVFNTTRLVICVSLLVLLLVAYLGLPLVFDFGDSFDDTECLVFHTIDVGQGDCVLVEFPDDKVLMVDAGLASKYTTVKNYLGDLHITTINWFVNTHPDADHYGGLPSLVQDFTIEKLYGSGYPSDNANYNSVAERMVEPTDMEKIIGSNYVITFVSPFRADLASIKNSNDSSLMMTIEYANKIFVLTGDASITMEEKFIERASSIFSNTADKQIILKVGHHGSRTSSGTDFLAFIFNPISKENNFAIISCGTTYGHPHAETLTRLKENCVEENIFVTKDIGNVVIKASESTLTINGKDYTFSYLCIFIAVGLVIIVLAFYDYRSFERRK